MKTINNFYVKKLFQDWLAFARGSVQHTFQGKLQFENGGAPLEQDNFAFCKVNYFLIKSTAMIHNRKAKGGTKMLNMINSLNYS